MCSNIWASPVLPLDSSTEPVRNIMRMATVGEKWRSRTSSLMPFGHVCSTTRFSSGGRSAAMTIRIPKDTASTDKNDHFMAAIVEEKVEEGPKYAANIPWTVGPLV